MYARGSMHNTVTAVHPITGTTPLYFTFQCAHTQTRTRTQREEVLPSQLLAVRIPLYNLKGSITASALHKHIAAMVDRTRFIPAATGRAICHIAFAALRVLRAAPAPNAACPIQEPKDGPTHSTPHAHTAFWCCARRRRQIGREHSPPAGTHACPISAACGHTVAFAIAPRFPTQCLASHPHIAHIAVGSPSAPITVRTVTVLAIWAVPDRPHLCPVAPDICAKG